MSDGHVAFAAQLDTELRELDIEVCQVWLEIVAFLGISDAAAKVAMKGVGAIHLMLEGWGLRESGIVRVRAAI